MSETSPPPAATDDQTARLRIAEGAPPTGGNISIEEAMRQLAQKRREAAKPNGEAADPGEPARAAPPREPRAEPAGDAVLDRLEAQLREDAGGREAPAARGDARAAPERLSLTVGGTTREYTQAELVDALTKSGGFTQKMQQLAEERRQFLAEKQQFEELLPTMIPEIQRQMQQLQQQIGHEVDWVDLLERDPHEYQRRDAARKNFEEQQRRLTQLQARERAEQEKRQAAALEAGHKWLAERLPIWADPQERTRLSTDLKKFGTKMGLTEQELSTIGDPRYVRILLYALAWDSSVSRTRTSAPHIPVVQRGSAPRGQAVNGRAPPEAEAAFRQNPTVNTGVAYLMAQRAAATRRGG